MTSPDTPTPSITVLPELLAYIDPLTADEEEALERSLLREGCRDALVLWATSGGWPQIRYRLRQLKARPALSHRAKHPVPEHGRRTPVDD